MRRVGSVVDLPQTEVPADAGFCSMLRTPVVLAATHTIGKGGGPWWGRVGKVRLGRRSYCATARALPTGAQVSQTNRRRPALPSSGCRTTAPRRHRSSPAGNGRQKAPLGLVALARMQPPMHLVPLGFAPHPGQPEQSAVVGLRGAQTHSASALMAPQMAPNSCKRDQSEQLRARTRRLHAEDEANRAQTALGSEMLAAKTLIRWAPLLASPRR